MTRLRAGWWWRLRAVWAERRPLGWLDALLDTAFADTSPDEAYIDATRRAAQPDPWRDRRRP